MKQYKRLNKVQLQQIKGGSTSTKDKTKLKDDSGKELVRSITM